MPIIVDEIVISVEVTSPSAPSAPAAPLDPKTQQVIVQQCVDRVLEVLRTRDER